MSDKQLAAEVRRLADEFAVEFRAYDGSDEARQSYGARHALHTAIDRLAALAASPSQADGVMLTDEQIGLAMLCVDDPLIWGRLGEGSGDTIRQLARALESAVRATQPLGHTAPASDPVAVSAVNVSTPEAHGWVAVEDRPLPRDDGTYLVACAAGRVAPHIHGVIHNNPGTAHDWNYGEAITHWMPLPPAPGVRPTQPVAAGDALDAARYRWLRDVGDATWLPMAARVPEGARGIDAAIDAAMALSLKE